MRQLIMAVIAVSALVGCGGTMDEAAMASGDSAIPQEALKTTTSSSPTNTGIVPPRGKTSTSSTTKTSKPTKTSSTSTVAAALRSTADSAMSASCSSWATSFPIFTTSAVYFAFDVPASQGHHTQRLDVYDERGALYQEIQVAFAAGVTAYTNEQAGEPLGNGLYRVWASLPVAGTAIDAGMMTGAWSAKSYVDSSGTASASETFQLN